MWKKNVEKKCGKKLWKKMWKKKSKSCRKFYIAVCWENTPKQPHATTLHQHMYLLWIRNGSALPLRIHSKHTYTFKSNRPKMEINTTTFFCVQNTWMRTTFLIWYDVDRFELFRSKLHKVSVSPWVYIQLLRQREIIQMRREISFVKKWTKVIPFHVCTSR